MAALKGNDAYLEFDGVDLSGLWTDEIKREHSVETEDTTHGSGKDYVERGTGLHDLKMSFVVIYDADLLGTYVGKTKEGINGILVYGPESNTAGKPKFSGPAILESVSQGQTIQKGLVKFELGFVQSAAPTHRIEDGSTF
jgi:hypothetical protein